MQEHPLKVIMENDADLFAAFEKNRELALSDGALSAKHKHLIALALDASVGAVNGVKALAAAAMELGATKEEIMETLRVTNFVTGGASVFTAAAGLNDIL